MDKPVLIVTGSATGIGLAAARLLSSRYHIVGTWNRTAPSEEDRAFINGTFIQCDVSREEDCARLVEEARSLGSLRGLVHAAAVNPTPAPSVADMSLEFWNRILTNNLTGTFLLCRAVLPELRLQGGGSIVLVSSTAGRNGFSLAGGQPGHAKTAYATSKAGIIAFTKGLAREVAEEGIRVNCVAPGPIDTRMLPNREATAKRVPMGRTGTAEECAEASAFMLDNATYTTGCTLDVCGGQYMN